MNYKGFVLFDGEDIDCLCIADKKCSDCSSECAPYIIRLDPINRDINKLEDDAKRVSQRLAREVDKISKISKKLLR